MHNVTRMMAASIGAIGVSGVIGVACTFGLVSTLSMPSASAQGAPEALAYDLVNRAHPTLFFANHFDQIAFDGWLGGAAQQTATRYSLEVVAPYMLSEGKGSVFLRVNLPFFFNEPIPVNHDEYVTVNSRFGDVTYDLYWAATEGIGRILGAGIRGTVPSASNANLGKKRWAVGPEFLYGHQWENGLFGVSLSHQWDFAGEGQSGRIDDIDLSELNYFYTIDLNGDWQVSAEPLVSYDHTLPDQRLTLPAGIGIAKVSRWAGLPWRFQLQYWNYIESSDIFAPQHQIRFSMTPVIKAPWN